MDIKLVNRGTAGELILNGRLDSSNASAFEDIVMQTAARFETLILNMGGMEYTSSAGIRIIKNAFTFMDRSGGKLVIKAARPSVVEVLEMTGFAAYLTFEE